jgi:hypothetical protein
LVVSKDGVESKQDFGYLWLPANGPFSVKHGFEVALGMPVDAGTRHAER